MKNPKSALLICWSLRLVLSKRVVVVLLFFDIGVYDLVRGGRMTTRRRHHALDANAVWIYIMVLFWSFGALDQWWLLVAFF